jgi:hypothetical protein
MAMVPVRIMVGVRANAYKTLLLNKNQSQAWTARNICQAMAKKMAVSNGGRKCSEINYTTWVLSYNTTSLSEDHEDTDKRKSKGWGKGKGRKVVLPQSYHRVEPAERVLELEHDGRGIFASENMAALELVFHENPEAVAAVVKPVLQQEQQQRPSSPFQRLRNRMSPRASKKQVGDPARSRVFAKRP